MLGRLAPIPLLFVALSLTACVGPGSWLRERSLVRGAFYPPVVDTHERLGPDTSGARFDHSLYGALLADAVDDEGHVDYDRLLARQAELDRYLAALAAADLDALSRHARLALLLNAYNAFTLRLILDHPGIDSIQDIPAEARWRAPRWRLGGEAVSLDALENAWIRPGFGEPRIHFALVCAALSCPKLRNEPYTGAQLVAQLDDQSRHFFRQPAHFRWDPSRPEVKLSEILDWYREDFGPSERAVVEWTLPYLDAADARALRHAGDRLRIGYVRYDWGLNGSWTATR